MPQVKLLASSGGGTQSLRTLSVLAVGTYLAPYLHSVRYPISSSHVVQARTQDSPYLPCMLIYLTRFRMRAQEISLQVTTLPSASGWPPVLPRRRRLWKLASALTVSWREESGVYPKEKDIAKKLPPPPPPPSHRSALLPSPPRPGSMHWIRIAVGGRATTDTVVPYRARRTELPLQT